MGFYGPVPHTRAEAFFVTEADDQGAFIVTVQGDALKFTSGIVLVRDPHFVGGLRINVMGWVGPRAEGTIPYSVRGTFPGNFHPVILVGSTPVPVRRVPDSEAAERAA